MATANFLLGFKLEAERRAKKELERVKNSKRKRDTKDKVANSLLERSIKEANPEGISQAAELLGLKPETAKTLYLEAKTSKRIRDEKALKEKQFAQILASMPTSDPERARIAAMGQGGLDRGFSPFPRPPGVAPAIVSPPTTQQTTPAIPGAVRPPMPLSPQGEQLGQGIDVEPRWMTAGLPREPAFRYGHEGIGGAGLEGRMARVVREAAQRQMTPQVGRGIEVEPPIADFPTLDPKTFMSPLERQQFENPFSEDPMSPLERQAQEFRSHRQQLENPFSEDPSGVALTDTAAAPFLPELPLPKSPIKRLLDEREKRLEKEKKTKGDGDDKRPLTGKELQDEGKVIEGIETIRDIVAGRITGEGKETISKITVSILELVKGLPRVRQKELLKELRGAQKVEPKKTKDTKKDKIEILMDGRDRAQAAVDDMAKDDPNRPQAVRDVSTFKARILRETTGFKGEIEIGSDGTVRAVFGAGEKLRPSVTSKIQDKIIVTGDTQNLIRRIRGILKAGTVGLAGKFRGTAQNLLAASQEFTGLMFGQTKAIKRQITNRRDRVKFKKWFDPKIPKLDLLLNVLAYRSARAEEGSGRLSDFDVQNAKDRLGFTRTLANVQDLEARLEAMMDTLETQDKFLRGFLREGMGTGKSNEARIKELLEKAAK